MPVFRDCFFVKFFQIRLFTYDFPYYILQIRVRKNALTHFGQLRRNKDTMSVQVEKLENNMAKLTIEVAAEEFVAATKKAYNKNKNQI